MFQTLITLRRAQEEDARAVALVHDAAWRQTYRGLIPGKELEQIISQRGSSWWQEAIRRRSNLVVLEFRESIVGYANYGRNRVPTLPYEGELFELYLTPEYQSVGFGARMFSAVSQDLQQSGYANFLVWVLEQNQRAVDFFLSRGGKLERRAQEKFGNQACERLAIGFSFS